MNYTTDEIQQDALDAMTGYDKTKGTWIWDIFRGVAILWNRLWDYITDVRGDYNPDKLTGEGLEAYVKAWKNIIRIGANYATGYITVTGNGTVKAGTRVRNTEKDVYYITTEDAIISEKGKIAVRCLTEGTVGNCSAGEIDRIILSAQGITSCINEEDITNGHEAESDEELRSRYYASMLPYGSGNKQHYKMWAKEIYGVGEVKVSRAPAGKGTVYVTIIKSDGTNADDELVAEVQEYIDPVSCKGQGEGMAPLGAEVTVFKADEVDVSITADIEIDAGYDKEEIFAKIETAITEYIGGLSFKNNELSYGKIYQIIFNNEGVVDCENLKLNTVRENIYCDDNEIFKPSFTFTDVI